MCKFQKEKKPFRYNEILRWLLKDPIAASVRYWTNVPKKNSHHNELHSYHYYEWTHFELLSRYTSVYNEILLICDDRIYIDIGHDLCLHLRIKKFPLHISTCTGYAKWSIQNYLLNQNYKNSTPLLKIITQMIYLALKYRFCFT